MTKLLEWLSLAFAFISVWIAVLSGKLFETSTELRYHVLLSPLYFVMAFGLVSLAIILYRTATFNDCPEAYQELRDQIKEAREDLASKGFDPIPSQKA